MSIGIGVSDVLKICEIAGRVYKNCRDCTGEYKSLTTEARSLTNLLEDINDKFDKIPANKHKQLEDAYEPCIDVLQELDKLVAHYNGLDTKSKRAWDRLKWDPAKSQTLRDRLTSSVTMLNSFYNSLIHDNQVLILEALERLEHDYKGGHREESIASLERITSGTLEDEEEEDAAWRQILRDLEDVGVAKQDALSYRDVIVDWLVKAVNEGRLLEQHAEPDPFESLSRDLEPVLLTTTQSHPVDAPGTHYLDVPAIFPQYQRSQSTPVSPPAPLIAPDSMSEQQRTQSIPSTASFSPPELSAISSNATSCSSDTDISSYGRPGPQPWSASVRGSTSSQIRRVPVPVRVPDVPQYATAPHSLVATSSSHSRASSVGAAAISDLPEVAPSSMPQPDWTVPAFTSPPLYVENAASMSTTAFPEPVPAPPPPPQLVPASAAPQVAEMLPSYGDKESTMPADLAWTAQQILAAWGRNDFVAAGRLLEEQLGAVERGEVVLTTGTQPDRRILRHLIGVCNSFAGNFVKAKTYFESVFNGIYLDRNNLDDGDIAAARWLGDVCFHLREHCNATLAWGVAYEGSTGRYGAVRDRTRRVADELRLLDHWLFVFRRIENSFHGNLDPTDIFRQTRSPEKSNLITSLKMRLYERNGFGDLPTPPSNPAAQPSYSVNPRQKFDMSISEGFLLSPLISLNAWPLPWDPTFSPMDAVRLDRRMNTIKVVPHITPLVERTLPTLTLGDSKKLHYVTRRGSRWLIETVKQGLQEMCIEHTESLHHESIVCTLNQHRDGYAFSEGIEISFKKLQFRSVFGLKISDVKWATRVIGPVKLTDTSDFRDVLKGILENAEREAAAMQGNGTSASALRKQPSFQSYR